MYKARNQTQLLAERPALMSMVAPDVMSTRKALGSLFGIFLFMSENSRYTSENLLLPEKALAMRRTPSW